MIHPNTRLDFINATVGYGVFATAKIPEGTIVYVKDSLELCISPEEYMSHSSNMKEVIEKYSYMDEKGYRIISWDFAKYVNHCCNCNTISTGYGFEIAIRDIEPGEQITDEYGLFNLDKPMPLFCGEPNCRKIIHPEDFDKYYETWDKKIRNSIMKIFEVKQALFPLLEKETRNELNKLYNNPNLYKSVYHLKYSYINNSKVKH